MKIQVLKKNEFPANAFFDHLFKGTEFYQNHNFGRAIEEWGAASRMNFSDPIYLKIIDGRIFFGSMIEEVPLIFFLYAIYINQTTGVGLIKSDEVSKKFVFRKGNIVFAASSSKKNRIGNYILKRKLLTAEELDRQAVEAKNKKKKLGIQLVEKGYLSSKALKEILTLQIQEIIANSLFWKKGLFYYVEKPVNEEIIVKYTPLKGALIAAQRGFNFTHFKKEVLDNRTIFRHSPYFLESKEKIIPRLNANEEFILSLIDGVRNIDQIIKFIGADEVSLINILYRLSIMGLIRKTKEIGEYEDIEFKELSRILKVLLEIHELITKEMQSELGAKARDIIQKAKGKLTAANQMLFENIPLDDPERVDANMILRNIASHFPSPENRFTFVDAFYEIYKNIMDEAKLFLGIGLVKEMIKKIKTIKADMETFSEDTPSKKRALKILTELIERY
ncbi:MAG TPA: hypothetical protein PLQ82_10905 [Desulfobacteraceae bacterium]|nr:hypothetical protein [Desulfobacteraceae bacterium]HPQ28976.1 hypothetical protein [Desulfobacteraceae bacterium]